MKMSFKTNVLKKAIFELIRSECEIQKAVAIARN